MDKDNKGLVDKAHYRSVSTLVLMDSWIKTISIRIVGHIVLRFNPCFNGFMDKDKRRYCVDEHL